MSKKQQSTLFVCSHSHTHTHTHRKLNVGSPDSCFSRGSRTMSQQGKLPTSVYSLTREQLWITHQDLAGKELCTEADLGSANVTRSGWSPLRLEFPHRSRSLDASSSNIETCEVTTPPATDHAAHSLDSEPLGWVAFPPKRF